MACVYKIENIVNGKLYVGCTSRTLSDRMSEHLTVLRNKTHSNPHLQHAFTKYGEENFEFSVLAECEEKDLADMERFYYEKYPRNRLYNCKVPDYNVFGGRLSDEVKEKIRKTMLQVAPFKGRKHTAETKRKMSENRRGEKSHMYGLTGKDHPSYGVKHTEETRRLWSEQRRGENNPNYGKRGAEMPQARAVIQIDIDTGQVVGSFDCIKDAAIAVGGHASNIGRACSKIYKTSSGFRWEYLENKKSN